jgi:DNA-binding CsgD family transcriptional regulator
VKPSTLQDLIDSAVSARSVEDVHAVCSALCRHCGFDYFIYGSQLPTSLVKPRRVIISGYPQEWREHYNSNGYLAIDPTVAHCISHVTPLVWASIGKSSAKGAPKARRFMADAHDFGLKSGVSFPVHGANGESAILSLASALDNQQASAQLLEAMPAASLLAGYVHEAVRRVFLAGDIRLGRVQLTEREKECLLWAAEGKTTWETAQILGISERTVVFHLKNVAEKLNVSNRPAAVARAVSQLLITPSLDDE